MPRKAKLLITESQICPGRQQSQLFPHPWSGSLYHGRRQSWPSRTCHSNMQAGWAWSPGCPVCATWWHSGWSTPWPSLAPRSDWQDCSCPDSSSDLSCRQHHICWPPVYQDLLRQSGQLINYWSGLDVVQGSICLGEGQEVDWLS